MVQTSRRTTLSSPTFVRQLARLTGVEPAAPRQSPTERLGQWLDWTHAIALAAALDAPPAGTGETSTTDDAEAECAAVRAALQTAIADDPAFSSTEVGADAALDSAFFRQRYLALQRTMDARIGRLRGRLRERLAAAGGESARLAAVDAALERALARREQSLLAAVPGLLDARFAQARQNDAGAGDRDTDGDGGPTATPAAQLEAFRRDMRGLLLAELDARLQPVEGLLAALRPREPGHHAQIPA
ncbi:DUF3348 family protein [Luteimonas huabeiensis]|uniref:DUF3348 family protein n=1 Tax=Luteimonas huabeiensis TaxID=1244513 RepID=UPI0004652389|nr:DUF3348 family protein [Luteimonas huabeiensis]